MRDFDSLFDGTALSDGIHQLSEFRFGQPLTVDQPTQAWVVGMGFEVNQSWQGQNPLSQILTRRFSQMGGVAGEVEHIIHDLESHADCVAKAAGGRSSFGVDSAEQGGRTS